MNTQQIIGTILILLLVCLSRKGLIDLELKYILYAFILFVAFNFMFSESIMEGLTATSNEAVQTLSSIYNGGTVSLSNLQISGTLKVGNSILLNGDPTAQNKIEIYQNSDGNEPKLSFDKTGKLNISSSATNASYLTSSSISTGDVIANGNVVANKNITATGDMLVNGNITGNKNITAVGNQSSSNIYVGTGTNKWTISPAINGTNNINISPYSS